MSSQPHIVVIAGPNGAGKSTIAPVLLRDYLKISEFVNADDIAKGLSAFDVEKVAFQAGRVMLQRLQQLADEKVNFAFETTLASKTFAPWIKHLRKEGYIFHLIYLWMPSPKICIERIEERVKMGGHDIPSNVVKRRYEAGLSNFFKLYKPLASSWSIYNNSDFSKFSIVATYKNNEIEIKDKNLWEDLKENYESE